MGETKTFKVRYQQMKDDAPTDDSTEPDFASVRDKPIRIDLPNKNGYVDKLTVEQARQLRDELDDTLEVFGE